VKRGQLPLPRALFFIVTSMLCTCGAFPLLLKTYRFLSCIEEKDTRVRSIVQTGPQREALKTEYLAEILEISADVPRDAATLNLKQLRGRLLSSPLISHATVSILKPNSLYIDYTVRQPIAYLADCENVAIDKEGYPVPFSPFFSPKNLPSLYLGLNPFGKKPENPNKPLLAWGHSLKGRDLELAFNILATVPEDLHVMQIDTSRAFSESCGTREIVLKVEDALYFEKEQPILLPRLLRLSPEGYAQQLSNYLKLRYQLLEEEKEVFCDDPTFKPPIRVIDLRIPNLAFVDELKT
jgi:hypothetical protein